ncbi:MAG: c-type cytochrome [Gammaproteobacteria bacterium]|nr:c-type cytochrome [Gammaproteobacteria bacterium]
MAAPWLHPAWLHPAGTRGQAVCAGGVITRAAAVTPALPLAKGVTIAADVSVDAQAIRGQTIFEEHCASCHGMNLRGSAHGPELESPCSSPRGNHAARRSCFATTSRTCRPARAALGAQRSTLTSSPVCCGEAGTGRGPNHRSPGSRG